MQQAVTIFQHPQRNATPSKKPRRRLLVRAQDDNLPSFRLTKRDIAIVNACYEFRALTSQQLQRLFFKYGTDRGQLTQCQLRLKLLYHHGYLYRDEQPTKMSDGRRPLVYFLDRKGAALLAECLEIPVTDLDWSSKNNAAGAKHLFIDHLLATNDVRISLILAAQQQQATIERWLDDKTLKSSQMKDQVTIETTDDKQQQIAIIPDGYFHLQAEQRDYHYFIEADMRTMVGVSSKSGRRDWAKKIRSYLIYKDSGKFQERYEAKSFRVLTVTTSDKRLQHLKQVTEEVGGLSLFWFTTFKKLQVSNALSAPIWQVAGRAGEYTLLHQQ
ncbi:MAG: replication-relaxation family protein [Caldilineaceae bacterium]